MSDPVQAPLCAAHHLNQCLWQQVAQGRRTPTEQRATRRGQSCRGDPEDSQLGIRASASLLVVYVREPEMG
jgi:hypothetical protein